MRAALLLVLIGGCAVDPALECDGFATSSPESLWCGAHRDVVLRFVRLTGDVDGQRSRLEWFRTTFYPKVAKAAAPEDVSLAVRAVEKDMPGFTRLFDQEHLWASRDTGTMNPDRQLPLMLAGFRHAVVLLDRELPPER